MTLREAATIALQELDVSEEEIKNRLAFADSHCAHEGYKDIKEGKERELIERLKFVEIARKIDPKLQDLIDEDRDKYVERMKKTSQNN